MENKEITTKQKAAANYSPTGNKKAKRRKWRKKLSFFSMMFLLCVGLMIVLVTFMKLKPLPSVAMIEPTVIVDSQGEVIDTFFAGQNQQYMPLDVISPYVVQATIAIEDRRFYSHFGIDMKSLGRAILVDLQHMEKKQGASTITQQLARNLYLSHERTWTRKAKEAVLALQLELQYSKKQILESYLNQIYYGHSAYGIESAAQLFFDKSASDLTLAESAMLAGIPKGPRYYSPFFDYDNAKSRQKLVLQAMVEQQYISKQQADLAYNEQLVFADRTNQPLIEIAPYFRDYIVQLIPEKLGLEEKEFAHGGLRVFTTLDLQMQNAAEQAIAKHMKNTGELQAALIAIDPRNGHVKAMVGGTNYNENQYNRVFATTRQPGSSFKPFVYLTALQNQNFTPATLFNSEPTTFQYDEGRKNYTPSNFGDRYANGPITLRRAIAESDNIYAVNTIMQVGAEHVIEMARKLGVNSKMQPLPSLALGTFPVSPFQMASSFGVIANQGVRFEPSAIIRIENSEGRVLYQSEQKGERVVEPGYTYVLTNLMESVFERGGTGYRVSQTIHRPIAGKTGTTNNDAWMVGFTPELSTAVWVGYDRDKTISNVESYRAAPIFAEFVENALKHVPPKIFPIPSDVVSAYIDPNSGMLATVDCPEHQLEVFVKGTEPTEFCTVHGGSMMMEQESELEEPMVKSWWQHLKRWWSN